MSEKTLGSLQKKATLLWRTKGQETATCELCDFLKAGDGSFEVSAHHVVPVTNLTLKWRLENRCWLCTPHHTGNKLSAHLSPKWFKEWFAKTRPEDDKFIKEWQHKIIQFTIEDMERIIELLELGRDN